MTVTLRITPHEMTWAHFRLAEWMREHARGSWFKWVFDDGAVYATAILEEGAAVLFRLTYADVFDIEISG